MLFCSSDKVKDPFVPQELVYHLIRCKECSKHSLHMALISFSPDNVAPELLEYMEHAYTVFYKGTQRHLYLQEHGHVVSNSTATTTATSSTYY